MQKSQETFLKIDASEICFCQTQSVFLNFSLLTDNLDTFLFLLNFEVKFFWQKHSFFGLIEGNKLGMEGTNNFKVRLVILIPPPGLFFNGGGSKILGGETNYFQKNVQPVASQKCDENFGASTFSSRGGSKSIGAG